MAQATVPIPSPREHLRQEPKSGTLQRRTYRVAISSGPDAGRTFALDHVLIIGTEETCGIVLTDPTVSRNHVELIARPDGVLIRDLDSTNGTWASGLRVREALLDLGGAATIKVGRTELELSSELEPVGELEGRSGFGRFRGTSAPVRALCALLDRVSPTNASVLLLGETGTGKEVLAREIHAHSHRAQGPFVVVDCGAIAPELIESELFGHVAGAFTGAVADRPGALQVADGGTLFLDEVGELPLALQPKLLRVLEHLMVQPVGSSVPTRVDVRIIAATHRHLESRVLDGTFRQDLFFRLAVVVATVPPLRERLEDIPELIQHLAREMGGSVLPVSTDLVGQLMGHTWPGNVRELRNVVQRLLMGVDPQFDDSGGTGDGGGFKEAKERVIDAFTREYLRDLMKRSRGNISLMARTSGLNRTHLHRLISRYGLRFEAES